VELTTANRHHGEQIHSGRTKGFRTYDPNPATYVLNFSALPKHVKFSDFLIGVLRTALHEDIELNVLKEFEIPFTTDIHVRRDAIGNGAPYTDLGNKAINCDKVVLCGNRKNLATSVASPEGCLNDPQMKKWWVSRGFSHVRTGGVRARYSKSDTHTSNETNSRGFGEPPQSEGIVHGRTNRLGQTLHLPFTSTYAGQSSITLATPKATITGSNVYKTYLDTIILNRRHITGLDPPEGPYRYSNDMIKDLRGLAVEIHEDIVTKMDNTSSERKRNCT
jgi:hypothetical protein